MEQFFQDNLEMWNDRAVLHAASEFYDVEGFRNGRCTLCSIETEEMGDVRGKSLLHLMCHFGLDTLSWGRRGAKVTGIDFSDTAIDIARNLSKETGIEADFVCSNIYDLPEKLDTTFDIVFTSAGVLCWLPDLERWGEIIARFLKPGGFFYILESHPVVNMLLSEWTEATEPELLNSYFYTPEPETYQTTGSYAGTETEKAHTANEWTHGMGDIMNSLIASGLKIEFLHEFPKTFYRAMPYMIEDEDGYWRIPGDRIPLMFTLKATKPV